MIRIQELAAGYGKKNLFSRLSFTAGPENSPLILAGKNGSGKSTLLRILAGFQNPASGSIIWEKGKPDIAWLPQHYRINLEIPVLEFIAMGCEKPGRWLSSRPTDAMKKSIAALSRLGLDHLAHEKTHQLSGGEWQLVCLAQMLVQDADLWLLDEPTAFLDIGYKKKVFRLLWEEAAAGRVVIFSTHDVPFLPNSVGTFILVGKNHDIFPNLPEKVADLLENLSD